MTAATEHEPSDDTQTATCMARVAAGAETKLFNPNGYTVTGDERACAIPHPHDPEMLLHRVAAQQRTPSVTLRYAVRRGADPREAADAIRHVLPSTRGHGGMWDLAMGEGA